MSPLTICTTVAHYARKETADLDIDKPVAAERLEENIDPLQVIARFQHGRVPASGPGVARSKELLDRDWNVVSLIWAWGACWA